MKKLIFSSKLPFRNIKYLLKYLTFDVHFGINFHFFIQKNDIAETLNVKARKPLILNYVSISMGILCLVEYLFIR